MAYKRNGVEVSYTAFWQQLRADLQRPELKGIDPNELEDARKMLYEGQQIIAGRTSEDMNNYEITCNSIYNLQPATSGSE